MTVAADAVAVVVLTFRPPAGALEATMSPYVFIAWNSRCTCGEYDEMSTLALRRSRAPIGNAPAVLPARWDAGHT